MGCSGGCQEYNLETSVDSADHNDWFYFSICGAIHNLEYIFNFTNLRATSSPFSELGMKPVVNSGGGWERSGSDISYLPNGEGCNTLRVRFRFSGSSRIFIAPSVPYTYSDLCSELESIEHDRYTRDGGSRASRLNPTLTVGSCSVQEDVAVQITRTSAH